MDAAEFKHCYRYVSMQFEVLFTLSELALPPLGYNLG
jgi:hypothetical protein